MSQFRKKTPVFPVWVVCFKMISRDVVLPFTSAHLFGCEHPGGLPVPLTAAHWGRLGVSHFRALSRTCGSARVGSARVGSARLGSARFGSAGPFSSQPRRHFLGQAPGTCTSGVRSPACSLLSLGSPAASGAACPGPSPLPGHPPHGAAFAAAALAPRGTDPCHRRRRCCCLRAPEPPFLRCRFCNTHDSTARLRAAQLLPTRGGAAFVPAAAAFASLPRNRRPRGRRQFGNCSGAVLFHLFIHFCFYFICFLNHSLTLVIPTFLSHINLLVSHLFFCI